MPSSENVGVKINIARYIDSNNQIYNLKTRKINGSAFNDVAPPQNAAEIHAVTFTDPTNDSIDEQSENVNNSNKNTTNSKRQNLDVQIEGTMNAKKSPPQSMRVASTSAQAPIEDIAKKSQNKRIDVLTDMVRRSGQAAESMITGSAQRDYYGARVGRTLNQIKSDIEAKGKGFYDDNKYRLQFFIQINTLYDIIFKKRSADKMANKRLDVTLFETEKVKSREKARALIMEGCVFVNGQKADKPGYPIKAGDIIELKEDTCPFVSRGGLKLQKALQIFNIDPSGMTALDIGASTGGFTDCLLQHGAKKIYSVDVGYNQLAYKLQTDERVIMFERMNFRYMPAELIPDSIDIAVMDVAFISITKLCSNLKNFTDEHSELIFLIKPQFEAERDMIGKNGVVHSAKDHISIVNNVIEKLFAEGYYLNRLDFSPIKGPKGNIEFISRFSRNITLKAENTAQTVKDCVIQAHEELKI